MNFTVKTNNRAGTEINDHLYYHFPCNDGFHAASRFISNFNRSCTYVGVHYGNGEEIVNLVGVPDTVHTLWFVDFCPGAEMIDTLVNKGYYINILDHHETGFNHIRNVSAETKESGKLRYVISRKGFCGSSLVAAYNYDLNYISETKIIEERTLTEFDEETGMELQLVSNLEYVLADRSTIAFLDKLIEAYDIWLKDSPLFRKALFLNSYLDKIGIGTRDPINSIDHYIKYGLLYIPSNKSPLDIAINNGEGIFHTRMKVAQSAVNGMERSVTQTKDGKDFTFYFGQIPNQMGTLIGLQIDGKSDGLPWAYAGFTYNFNSGKTSLQLRSGNGCIVRGLAEVIGGGGHDQACGCTYCSIIDINGIYKEIYANLNKVYINE